MDEAKMIENMKKHLGRPDKLVLEGREGEEPLELELNPLTNNDLPELYTTLNVMKGYVSFDPKTGEFKINPNAIYENMSKDFVERIKALGLKALKPNYSYVDDDVLTELVARNVVAFANKMWSQNLGNLTKIGRVQGRGMERIKELQNAARNKDKSE